jgi:hypothetical protein
LCLSFSEDILLEFELELLSGWYLQIALIAAAAAPQIIIMKTTPGVLKPILCCQAVQIPGIIIKPKIPAKMQRNNFAPLDKLFKA